MDTIEMDICKGCGVNFVYGEGSARISILRYDTDTNSYFYEHDVVCPDCVSKIIKEEE